MRFVLVSCCGGFAAGLAAPVNKNPPVRIASGGCVVSDVKGGVERSRFSGERRYVRIPISAGGLRCLDFIAAVLTYRGCCRWPGSPAAALFPGAAVAAARTEVWDISAAPFDPARDSRAQSYVRAGLLTRSPPCAFPTDGSVASCTTLPPQRRNSQQRVLFRLRTGFPFNPVVWTEARTLQRYIFSA